MESEYPDNDFKAIEAAILKNKAYSEFVPPHPSFS
jgi:hypothetical protein